MTDQHFSVLIASLPQYDNVVAEVYFENQQVAEISQEVVGHFVLEIFPKPGGGLWKFDLLAFEEALKSAAVSLGKL